MFFMDNNFALKLKGMFHRLHLDCKRDELSPRTVLSREEANEAIISLLSSDSPCMIARYGANELAATVNYLGVKEGEKSYWGYARGTSLAWWWYDSVKYYLSNNAGFFPTTDEMLCQFGQLMLDDSKYVDVLGAWNDDECYLKGFLNEKVKYIRLYDMDPFEYKKPWTKVLKNQRVLVIHPFAESIKSQYSKRTLLFSNKDILPEFRDLQVIKAVQSIGGSHPGFPTWFDALDDMKSQIEKSNFDVCLIACGAYGFPLAAYIKRLGKKAVHWGGALQLLFGIKGKRWETPFLDGDNVIQHSRFYNEHWVRPLESEHPTVYKEIEGSCYW